MSSSIATTRPGTPHDVDAIVGLHTPDMVYENYTAGEHARGDDVRTHLNAIFETLHNLSFEVRSVRAGPDHALCAWTATATQTQRMCRGELVGDPAGRRLTWRGVDVFAIRDGRIARKAGCSDSVTILRAARWW